MDPIGDYHPYSNINPNAAWGALGGGLYSIANKASSYISSYLGKQGAKALIRRTHANRKQQARQYLLDDKPAWKREEEEGYTSSSTEEEREPVPNNTISRKMVRGEPGFIRSRGYGGRRFGGGRRKFRRSGRRFGYRRRVTPKRIYKICDYVLKRNIERKFKINLIEWNSNSQLSVPSVFDLTEIDQGTKDEGQRIGDEIMVTSLQMHIHMEMNGDTTLASGGTTFPVNDSVEWRLIVFQWNENSTFRTPLGSDIVYNIQPYTFYRMDNAQNYWVLFDKKYVTSNLNNRMVVDTAMVSAKNKKIHYVNAGTQGTNKIYCMLLASRQNISTYGSSWDPHCKVNFKLNYKDT